VVNRRVTRVKSGSLGRFAANFIHAAEIQGHIETANPFLAREEAVFSSNNGFLVKKEGVCGSENGSLVNESAIFRFAISLMAGREVIGGTDNGGRADDIAAGRTASGAAGNAAAGLWTDIVPSGCGERHGRKSVPSFHGGDAPIRTETGKMVKQSLTLFYLISYLDKNH